MYVREVCAMLGWAAAMLGRGDAPQVGSRLASRTARAGRGCAPPAILGVGCHLKGVVEDAHQRRGRARRTILGSPP
eukprot:3771528-Prymnesium_polylepis.1